MIDRYPYMDPHELNLDWLINTVKNMEAKVNLVLGDDDIDDKISESIERRVNAALGDVIEPMQYEIVKHGLEKAKNSLKDMPCILIGNSYMYGSGATANQGWGYWFTQYTRCDSKIIQQRSGDFCAQGSEYADFPNMSYLPALISWEAREHITDEYKQSVKWVIVGGGLNDYTYTDADIVEAIRVFAEHVRETYPNARLAIIPLGGAVDSRIRSATPALMAWARGAMLAGAMTSTATITNHYGRALGTSNPGDTAHLNESGYKVCAREIQSVIFGNDVPYQAIKTDLVPSDAFELLQGQYIRLKRDGNKINIIAWGTVSNVSDNTVLFTLPELYAPAYSHRMTVSASAVKSGSLYPNQVRVPIEIIVGHDHTVKISSPTTDTVSGTLYIDVTYEIA